MPISFHKEEIEFDLPGTEILIPWLEEVASSMDKKILQITYVFCSDEYLLDINKTHLNHDYYTDIITFPYKQGKEIESDIFISIDRIRENAIEFGSTFENELLRVMVHGLLHLLGYKDKTSSEKTEMSRKEDWAIEIFYQKIKQS
jgi:rRNA maturation RNase YbeY